jgi:hypothetical protein
MRWLRLRPQALDELNAVDWRGRWIGSDDDAGFEDSDREGGPLERFDDDEGSQVRILAWQKYGVPYSHYFRRTKRKRKKRKKRGNSRYPTPVLGSDDNTTC